MFFYERRKVFNAVLYILFACDAALAIESLGSQQFVVPVPGSSQVIDERMATVSSDGQPAAFSGQTTTSCIAHVGCFQPHQSRRPSVAGIFGSNVSLGFDPVYCFTLCLGKNLSIAAVSGNICGCSSSVHTMFNRADSFLRCNIPCSGTFRNRLCGGEGDYWNVYKCYTYERLSSLAVDPFRDIAFKTVTIDWVIEGDLPTNTPIAPRKLNILFASDLTSGAPLLQYQMIQPDEESFSGLKYDVDSSRLVGMILPSPGSSSGTTQLVTIDINTTIADTPVLAFKTFNLYSDRVEDVWTSAPQTLGDPVSGIISRNDIQTYVMTFSGYHPSTSVLLFIDISPPSVGAAFLAVALDCIPTQLAVNDYYGDVAILAPRQGKVQFIAIATVFRDRTSGRLSAQSYWDPTGMDLRFVASVSDTMNLNLIAGVSASIPMQNQSCHGIMLYQPVTVGAFTDDRQLLLNQPSSTSNQSGWNNLTIPSVVCFDIRKQGFMQLWGSSNGTARTTENGTVQTAITMNLFQTDPGYPMTLSRPEMTLCEISVTALSVMVKFDSVTLMGGRAVDTNHDGIPDRADMSTQVTTPQPASSCFTNSSLAVLNGATCVFTQGDVLTVNLDRQLSIVTFNDALCIKPNFVCRNQGVQWSPYATGCCRVTLPPDVQPPKPVLVATPSLTVDVCSDLVLDLSDSLYCGRGCTYQWRIVSVGSTGGSLGYSAEILAQFSSGLSQLLLFAKDSVGIPSAALARSAKHLFNVTVTSSWKRVSSVSFVVEKLAEPMPTVTIPGLSRLVETQTTDYTISAVGQISGCNGTANSISGKAISYLWQFSNCSVSLDRLGILTTQNTIHIPGGTHSCPTAGAAWTDHGINKVVCEQCIATVSVFVQGSPMRNSTASVTVSIVKSPVAVKCLNPDTGIVTKGPIWFLNCANSMDLDDPASFPFQGSLSFTCTDSAGNSCFPSAAQPPTCLTDFTQPRVEGDGGAMYPQVILSATQGYCRLSRGIIAVNTNLLAIGNFAFAVSIVHFDGLRAASKTINVAISNVPMPKVSMALYGTPNSGGKYPVSRAISIEASVSLDVRAVNVVYTWTLLSQQLNKDFDTLASQRAAARGDFYNVSQLVFLPVPNLVICGAHNQTLTPALLIPASCLDMATSYAIRLNITWNQSEAFSTYSELLFSTANGPPRGGQLSVSNSGSSCDIPRTLTADNWASEDTPITYRFGYLVPGSSAATTAKFWFTDAAQPVRSFTGLIPCGSVTAFVQVTSSGGEFDFAFKLVKANPPTDPSSSAGLMVQQAQSLIKSDPTQAYSLLMTAASLTPKDPSTAAAVAQTQCSSADCGNRILVFLNGIVTSSSNALSLVDPLLSRIEETVDRISPSDAAALEQTQTVLDSLSSVLRTFTKGTVASSDSVQKSLYELATECGDLSVSCGRTSMACVLQNTVGHSMYVCCDFENPLLACTDTPCWFVGSVCLDQSMSTDGASETLRSIQSLRDSEFGPLDDSRVLEKLRKDRVRSEGLARERFKLYMARFEPDVQEVLLAEHIAAQRSIAEEELEAAKKSSETFSRIFAARQAIVKKLVATLVRDQPPLVFNTEQFTMTIGKTTDMSSALPDFLFPRSFTVPRSSPDTPTASNPVTGFSYMYVQYKTDLFSWALNYPSNSASSTIVSLEVMRADPSLPLIVPPNESPIRVFANRDIHASGACKVMDEANLGWTGEGAVNDGRGCLISLGTSTVGLFIDPAGAVTNQSIPIGNYESRARMSTVQNFFASSILLSVIAVHAALYLVARRRDRANIDPPRTIFLDGDGITGPASLNDPIAYGESSLLKFHLKTFTKVMRMRTIVSWPFFYHPIVLRPLRVMLSCLLATSSMLMSTIFIDQFGSTWSPPTVGVLTSVVTYFIYLLFRVMVDRVPHPARLRPVKGIKRSLASVLTAAQRAPSTPRPRLNIPIVGASSLCVPEGTVSTLMPVGLPVRRDESPPPPPPPPLTEDPRIFIRRVQHVYAEKSSREHEKQLIALDSGEASRPVPASVQFIVDWLIYLCIIGWIIVSLIYVPLKTVYYDSGPADLVWLVSNSISLCLSLTAWDPTQCLIIAEVEIKRYYERQAVYIPPSQPVYVPSAPPRTPPLAELSPRLGLIPGSIEGHDANWSSPTPPIR